MATLVAEETDKGEMHTSGGNNERSSSPPLAAGLAAAEGDMRDILKQKLEAKRSRLGAVQEGIKKFVGERIVPPVAQVGGGGGRSEEGQQEGERHYGRGGAGPGRFQNRLGPPMAERGEGSFTSRLGSRVSAPKAIHDDDEGAGQRVASRAVTSRVVIESQKSREDALAEQRAQKGENQRNRRMFGSLLGTLQKFRQDESKVKEREQKKREVEKKVEERTEAEKERVREEKRSLFSEKKKQEVEIRVLERQMARAEEFAVWESAKKATMNFIKTKTSSPSSVFFLPKEHNDATLTLVEENMEAVEKELKAGKERFEEELLEIEESLKNPAKRLREFEDEEAENMQPRSTVTRIGGPSLLPRFRGDRGGGAGDRGRPLDEGQRHPADDHKRRTLRDHEEDDRRDRYARREDQQQAKRRREDDDDQCGVSSGRGVDSVRRTESSSSFAPEKIVVVVKREKSLERDAKRDAELEREQRPVAAVAPLPRIKRQRASVSPKGKGRRSRKASSSSSSSSSSSEESSDSSSSSASDSGSSSDSSDEDDDRGRRGKKRRVKKERD